MSGIGIFWAAAYFGASLVVGLKARELGREFFPWILVGLGLTPFFGLILLIVLGGRFRGLEGDAKSPEVRFNFPHC